MSAIIMSGTSVAAEIKESIKSEICGNNFSKCLAIIQVGNDPASNVYIKAKKKDCGECGIITKHIMIDSNESVEYIADIIKDLNDDQSVSGIILQLPLPEKFTKDDTYYLTNLVNSDKDVDCFSSTNVHKLFNGYDEDILYPCTPSGIIELLDRYGIEISGKHCVIVGRSTIVGKPLALMMINRDATVTLCHSKTTNLKELCLQADILVSAVGKEKIITVDMVKQDAVVIDVGINRNRDGKLCGDVDFENVKEVASYITPVPGGVGVMTRAMLLKNIVKTK